MSEFVSVPAGELATEVAGNPGETVRHLERMMHAAALTYLRGGLREGDNVNLAMVAVRLVFVDPSTGDYKDDICLCEPCLRQWAECVSVGDIHHCMVWAQPLLDESSATRDDLFDTSPMKAYVDERVVTDTAERLVAMRMFARPSPVTLTLQAPGNILCKFC